MIKGPCPLPIVAFQKGALLGSRYFLGLVACLFFWPAFTQTAKLVQLEDCYEAARKHTVLSAQPALLRQQSDLRTAQIQASRKPELSLNSRASLQTENVNLGIESPFFSSPDLPLFQFRLTVDGTYTLYDGGLQKARAVQESSMLRTKEQAVEAEVYALYERVNQPFFGILLLRQKIRLLQAVRDDLNNRTGALQGAIQAGVRLPGDLERLRIQDLRLEAEIEKTRHDIWGLFKVLEALTGMVFGEDTELVVPQYPGFAWDVPVRRPELRLFQLQQEQIRSAEALLQAQRRPKAAAFLQTGVGYPNPLNFFEDQLRPFAIGGVQFTWKILDWEQTRRERDLLDIQRALVQNRQELFVQQLNLLDGKYREEQAALESLIRSQEAIAQRQERIREESAAQVELGVLSVTDYLSDVQAALQTQLQLEAYRLQLLQLHTDYLTLKGQR